MLRTDTGAAASAADDAPYRPRWLVLAPFLGRAPALTRRQWRVLGLVSAATLFDQYDRSLFAMALPQIQADLGIAESQVGLLGSIVRLGALPALLLALAADRLGRRRLLLFTVLAYTLLTGATALARDPLSFVVLQFFARTFTTAEVLLAVVVLSEELDAEVRGWGIGALFAIQSCGVGLAAALLPLVALTDSGWRLLYAVGLVPLLLLAWWRRSLPETERFEAHRREAAAHAEPGGALAPLFTLLRAYPGRFTALAAATFAASVGTGAADFLGAKYLQDAHGWAPAHVSVLYVLGGAFAIAGAVFVGRLSDRIGRRPVAVAVGALVPLLALAFFNGSGWLLPPLWVLLIVGAIAYEVLGAAFASELFPTSHRSTAGGARATVATLGVTLGLALESALYVALGSHWHAVSALLLVAFAAPLVMLLRFPETARRSLEDIAPEAPSDRG